MLAQLACDAAARVCLINIASQKEMFRREIAGANLDIREIHKHTAINAVNRDLLAAYGLNKDIFGRLNFKPCQFHP
jgi:hypothetical protein